MADVQHHQDRRGQHQQSGGGQQHKRAYEIVKAATSVTAGGTLLVLSGLTLAGTVIALTLATPLFVLFSPVLVPAVVSAFLIITGFFASCGFGVAAVSVLTWIYRYLTGRHPPDEESLDYARRKLGRDIRDRADPFGQQHGVHGQS